MIAFTSCLAQAQHDEANVKKTVGFSVRKEDDRFTTAVEDFNRHVEKKHWEAAFRVLDKLTESEAKGMVPSDNGFFVPSKLKLRALLAALPAEGREAYRLFYDARARQIFDAAIKPPTPETPVDELASLKKIADQYAMTTIGEAALDRLGDALFESGDFSGAAQQWRTLINSPVDSGISRIRLHAKLASALAAAKQWDEFDRVFKTVKDDFAGQSVTIAGSEQNAAAFIQSLKTSAVASTQSVTVDSTASRFEMPTSNAEAWKTEFVPAEISEMIAQRLQQTGWGNYMDPIDKEVASHVVDGQRIYLNYMGVVFSIDLTTGKLAWVTGKFADLKKSAQQWVDYSVDPSRFMLTLIDKRLYVTGKPPTENAYNMTYPLLCLNPETGKTLWTSEAGATQEYNFCSVPILVDGTLYVCVTKQGSSDLILSALDPANGKQKWSMTLGTVSAGQNFRGQLEVPQPALQYDGGTLYVLTNNGALLSVDPYSKSLNWMFKSEADIPVDNENRVFWGGYSARPPRIEPKSIFIHRDGLLIVKEEKSDTLYALDSAGPRLAWKRPLNRSESVAGIVGDRLITFGVDAGAINLSDKKLQWSLKLPAETGASKPVLLDGDRALFNLGRGLYLVSTRNGDVLKILRGADVESAGGAIHLAGDKIVTVSNRSVTAYSIPKTESK